MAAAAHRDDLPEYGPCMAALNERQRVFVEQYILTGNASLAAKLAGYGTAATTDEIFGRLAWQLKQRPKVVAAIAEQGPHYLRLLAPPAIARLARIITDPKSKDSDALRAIDMVMLRTDPVVSGQVVQVNHNHSHQIRLSADQITKRILELAGRVGVALPAPVTIDAVAIDAVASAPLGAEEPAE